MTRARRPLLLASACAVLVACSTTAPTPPPPTSSGTPVPSASGPPPPTTGTAGTDGTGDAYYPADGNGGYDVTAYDVSITYDPSSHHLDGDTTVTATATQDLSRFDLDLLELDVSAVDVDGKPATVSRSGDHELVITPPAILAKGAVFHTRVRYSGKPSQKDGDLGSSPWHISKSGGAFAAGEPHSSTYWYPSNDHPSDKAAFRLNAKVPNGWSVISNGVEQPSTPEGDWTTYHWAEATPLATYLTMVGIDKWTFDRSTYNGIPLVSAYAPGAEDKRSLESRLPEILDFLAGEFGPYPQDAAGGVYVSDNINFSLETQTRPTYAHWTDLETVVHENAHQWFGDTVSVGTWADICLNECFASYAQWLWNEAKDKTNLDQRYRDFVNSNRTNTKFWNRKLYDMGAGNEFTAVYSKGPVALHALRRQIGDDAFNKVLKEWPAMHHNGTATWPQFEDFVQKTANQDLKGFFDAWFHQDKIPGDQYLFPGSLRG